MKNNTILISGGCGLLGSVFSKELISEGAKVIITDICESSLLREKKKLQIIFPNTEIHTAKLDITKKNEIQSTLNLFHRKIGPINTLINNAYPRNKNYGKHFFDVGYDDFSQNVSMHLGGYFLMCQIFADYFIKNKIDGNIINIASIYVVISPRFEIYEETEMTTPVEYSVIKSGLIHLTKYISKYLKDKYSCKLLISRRSKK